jgi:hypothetical protein
MASNFNDIEKLQGGRLEVGLSSIISLDVSAAQNAVLLRYLSGGSLEIGGASLTWGQGFLMDSSLPLSANSSGNIYFAATGATVTISFLKGHTPGSNAG